MKIAIIENIKEKKKFEIEINFICPNEDPTTPYEQRTYIVNAFGIIEAEEIALDKAKNEGCYNYKEDIVSMNSYNLLVH